MFINAYYTYQVHCQNRNYFLFHYYTVRIIVVYYVGTCTIHAWRLLSVIKLVLVFVSFFDLPINIILLRIIHNYH